MNTDLKQNLIALLEEQFISSDDKVVFDYVMQKKIKSQGYHLQRNFSISISGGRKGFIDCLVTSPDGQQRLSLTVSLVAGCASCSVHRTLS